MTCKTLRIMGIAVLVAAGLAGCRHGRADNHNRADKLAKMLNQERTEKKLAALEKELKKLRAEVAKKNELLGKLAALGKKAADVTGKSASPDTKSGSRPSGSGAAPKSTAPGTSAPLSAGKTSPLQMRILAYRNGKMQVEVYNPNARIRNFTPRGLYFVPVGTKRAQRMGAAGPYEIWRFGTWQPATGYTAVPPNRRMRMRLQLFCLDRGRSWPSNAQRFTVARKRLPKRLLRPIRRGVKTIMRGRRRYRPKARRAVQRHIWRMRRDMPSQLQGD
jgi:hypothetical protein